MSVDEFLKTARVLSGRGADGKRKRVERGGRGVLKPLDQALEDAKRRASSGEWDDAKGLALVGLYAFCHHATYGVLPAELYEQSAIRMACKSAAACMHAHFDDDPFRVVEFIKWAWKREQRRVDWALKQGNKDRARLAWRLQFSASFVTDYKVEAQKRGPR